jgi:polyisoprenoid-binding protein YceI
MKPTACQLLGLLTLLLAPVLGHSAPEKYTLDDNHTYVEWHINHMGFSNYSGKWFTKGELMYDKEKPQDSKVNVTIAIDSMVTGNKKLDKHLKSKDFFNESKYPQATFVSDKITPIDDQNFDVAGTLTVHGIAKPTTLHMKINQVGPSPITKKDTIGFSGHTTLKRSDFDIKAYLPALGDEVKINVEGEANK